MPDSIDLPDGWETWNDEPGGRAIFAYRPDVFDGDRYPAACMPTLYVSSTHHTRREGVNPRSRPTSREWFVTLYLEPAVSTDFDEAFDTKDGAIDFAVRIAERFAAGKIDYRGLYRDPREAYLDALDSLTGRSNG